MIKRKKRKKRSAYDILYDKCWDLWSLYRRIRDANDGGYTYCITCNKLCLYSAMDLGHLRHGGLDFDPINTNPQCVYCNQFQSGQRDLYYIWVVKHYGQKATDDLYLRANTTSKKDNYPMEWLEKFAVDTTLKIIEEFDKRNLPLPKKVRKTKCSI